MTYPANLGAPVELTWEVIYEGKKYQGDTFEKVRDRLHGYANAHFKSDADKCWCVGAVANQVAVWKFIRKNTGDMQMCAVYTSQPGQYAVRNPLLNKNYLVPTLYSLSHAINTSGLMTFLFNFL